MKIRCLPAVSLALILSFVSCLGQEASLPNLDYRSIRKEATGREHAEIKTPRGTIFYKVKIQRIDNYRITIEHQDGRSILEYSSIPEEWIKEFNIVDRSKKKSTSSNSSRIAIPDFNLSGTIKISGDTQEGKGILVQLGENYYVYTDCSVISKNKKISMQTENGKVLKYANVIECADGIPLARIQVRLTGDDVTAFKIAGNGAAQSIKAHQYLYVLKGQEKAKAVKFKSVTANKLELQSHSSLVDMGVAIMLDKESTIGFVLGDMPDNQRPDSNQRFLSKKAHVARLDVKYTWKKIRLSNYLIAQNQILEFDKQTKLLKAFSDCKLIAGKISIPSSARSLFNAYSKDSNVSALLKLSDTLAKKSMRANEKEVQRKLNSITGSALRAGKKKASAISLGSFSWYHQHFLKESISWRKSALVELER